MADESAPSPPAGEQVLAESLTDLRDEEDILDEPGRPAEEETPVEEVPAEETEIEYGEEPTEEPAETEIAEAAAGGVEENERLPDLEEPPGAIPPAETDRQQPPVEPVKPGESRESLLMELTEQGSGPLPAEGAAPAEGTAEGPKYRFTVGTVLREAWAKTRGAKGAIWAGSAVMYLVLLILVACGAFLLPMNGESSPADTTAIGLVGNMLFQAVTNAVSVLFTAGLLFMGIKKAAGDPVAWRMVFTGFPVAGKIIVAAILQSILVIVGILLLVLPGIYLAIGYTMTMPLIIDRGMSPWQAMEASRKAIHKVWWKVAGLFFVMGLIFLLSMVPLGIGTIWTWPMFFILGGVVYHHLFGVEKKVG